jgi:hypothetical protein
MSTKSASRPSVKEAGAAVPHAPKAATGQKRITRPASARASRASESDPTAPKLSRLLARPKPADLSPVVLWEGRAALLMTRVERRGNLVEVLVLRRSAPDWRPASEFIREQALLTAQEEKPELAELVDFLLESAAAGAMEVPAEVLESAQPAPTPDVFAAGRERELWRVMVTAVEAENDPATYYARKARLAEVMEGSGLEAYGYGSELQLAPAQRIAHLERLLVLQEAAGMMGERCAIGDALITSTGLRDDAAHNADSCAEEAALAVAGHERFKFSIDERLGGLMVRLEAADRRACALGLVPLAEVPDYLGVNPETDNTCADWMKVLALPRR